MFVVCGFDCLCLWVVFVFVVMFGRCSVSFAVCIDFLICRLGGLDC